MEKRENPVITVTCKCGATFSAAVMESIMIDEDYFNDLLEYAKEGYEIRVVDTTEVRLQRCTCK